MIFTNIRHVTGDKHSHINGKAPITPTGFISLEVLLTPFSKCRYCLKKMRGFSFLKDSAVIT